MLEIQRPRGIEVEQKALGLGGACRQLGAIYDQERVGGGEGRALIAVDKRMVLRQAFPERGCFLDQVGVVAGLRAKEAGFEEAGIAYDG